MKYFNLLPKPKEAVEDVTLTPVQKLAKLNLMSCAQLLCFVFQETPVISRASSLSKLSTI